MSKTCSSLGCNREAILKCPICLREGKESMFCSQECFKNNYADHKLKFHKTVSPNVAGTVLTGTPWTNFKFTGTLRPYTQSPRRTVPVGIARPDYADHPLGYSQCEQSETPGIKILNDEEIEGMRIACKLGREVLDEALAACAVGVTTDEVDRIAHEACVERECYPSPLNYFGFPKSCCTSINEVICHGIPDLRPLESGDILRNAFP